MLTYLIYPDRYWPVTFLYWPLGGTPTPVPAYDTFEECGTAVWIPDEDREPTGNNYIRPEPVGAPAGNDHPGPFGPWRKGGRT